MTPTRESIRGEYALGLTTANPWPWVLAGVGKKLEWDVEKMQCTNDPAVNKYLRREYRKGWEV